MPALRRIRTDLVVPAADVGGVTIAAFDAYCFPADPSTPRDRILTLRCHERLRTSNGSRAA
jgi:hypothetical protein